MAKAARKRNTLGWLIALTSAVLLLAATTASADLAAAQKWVDKRFNPRP